MEKKARIGRSALLIIGIIYTALGGTFVILGIALAAQFAADTCREAGMAAAAPAAELGGRILALLQALPLLQELLDCFAGYLQ